jgi:SLT domain-containing protein
MGFGEAIRGFGARLSKGTLMDYLPGMAEGGIVTKPTIAMIGEAGPEAVVPLGRGGTPLNYNPIINVTSNGNSIDVNSLVRTINEKLYADLRRVGVR